MARAQGARAQILAAFESTYGTAPASGYLRLPFASSNLDAQQAQQESELLGYGRDPLAPTLDATDVDGDVVVPIDAVGWGFWLKAAFGAPTTTGTGTYTHTFNSGGWTLPSFSIETGMPEVPSYSMVSGLRLNELSWDVARKGLLTATAKLIGQGENTAATSAAGTPTDIDVARFSHFHGAVSMGGSALADCVGASVRYTNNLDRVETIRGDGLIGGIDPGMAGLSGQVTLRFASRTMLDQAKAGDPVALAFGYELPGGESFTFTVHAAYLSRPRREISGPGGVQVTFDWIAARAASPARMCTAVLVNDKATY